MALFSEFLCLRTSFQVIIRNIALSYPPLLYYHHLHFSSASSKENPSPSPSINNKNDHLVTAMSSFLVEGLGFSHSQISSLWKKYPKLFRPTSNPLKRTQHVATLFKEYGFTDAHIRHIIFRQPNIVSYRADENLRPKLETLKSLGFKGDDLGNVVSHGPRILTFKDLQDTIEYYKSMFRGNANLLKAVKRYPRLLSSNANTADTQIKLLKQCGFSQDWIFYVICKAPWVLTSSTEATRARIQYMQSFGVRNSKTSLAVMARSLLTSQDKLGQKVKMLGTLGLSEEEVKDMVRKRLDLLLLSSQKVKKTADFLVQIGVPLKELVKYYNIFALNLEKRIKPRHDAFVFLKEAAPFQKDPSIITFLKMSDKMFLNRQSLISQSDTRTIQFENEASKKKRGIEILPGCSLKALG